MSGTREEVKDPLRAAQLDSDSAAAAGSSTEQAASPSSPHDDAPATAPKPLGANHFPRPSSDAQSAQTVSPSPAHPETETPPPGPTIRMRPRKRRPPPAKGILKPPTIQQSRFGNFNFRRDILQPFNSRLAYTAYGGTPSSSGTSGVEAEPKNQAGPVGTVGNVAAAAGGFWGSALKKLSTVTGAGGAPLMRDLSEEGTEDARTTVEKEHLPNPHEHHHIATGPAPHTPSTRASVTSSSVASSPYATGRTLPPRASTSALPISPPPLSVGELKKVRFRMAALKVVYPIGGPGGPLAPYEEGLTKRRVNSETRASRRKSCENGDSKGWTGEELGRLYAECCRTREEPGNERIRRVFRDNPRIPPKTLDLSGELLSKGAMEALADVLSVDFGLKKLILEGCGLDDESLKPLLHALLVAGTLPTLNLANNKRIKARGWKMIAIFVRKAKFLRYLDLSENSIDKKSADLLVQAITSHSSPESLASELNLPLSDPPLRSSSPEPIITSPSSPPLLTDTLVDPVIENSHPDDIFIDDIEDGDPEPIFTSAPLLMEGGTEAGTVLSLRLENCGLRGAALEALAHGVRASNLKHISIRRNRINHLAAVAVAIMIRDYPVPTDSNFTDDTGSQSRDTPLSPITPQSNGTFASPDPHTTHRTLQAPYVRKPSSPIISRSSSPTPGSGEASAAALAEREAWTNSEARSRLKKQIEDLPRTGSLLTLDVKGNDLRNGVSYIAQVLKRNRTLKVLNLSENKIDVPGLVAIAEALKYNGSLETLDMSLNPCCGPALDGIATFRAAITINTTLKRVFLNSTDLSSEGAIALAEFLPEAASLIHLDLTGNNDIDIAGVMALSVAVKMNTVLRCLDLNIPPNDPDFARLSQEILQCCVRNTELAQEESLAKGQKVTITAPILKSAVARDLKERQEAEQRRSERAANVARSSDEILTAAEECRAVLADLLEADEAARAKGQKVVPGELVRDLLVQAQLAEAQLAEAVAATRQGNRKARAISLGDQLSAILDRAKRIYDDASPSPSPLPSTPQRKTSNDSHLKVDDAPVGSSSPTFSITDSDDSDAESSSESHTSPNPLTEDGGLAGLGLAPPDGGELSPRSPIEDHSRSWTAEEGEVFRKGSALGTGEADDEELEDVSGEELKKEVLKAEIERSPRPSFGSSDEARPDPETLR